MSPRGRVLHTKNAIAFFAQTHAAVTLWKLCFRRLKEDGENCGVLYGKKRFFLVGARIARPLQRKTIFISILWGSEAARGE